MDADTLLHQTVVRLRAHEGKYAEIARQNPDIGYSWLTKLAHGQITNPTIASLQQLIEALNAFEGLERGGLAEVVAQADPVMDPVMEQRAEPMPQQHARRVRPVGLSSTAGYGLPRSPPVSSQPSGPWLPSGQGKP